MAYSLFSGGKRLRPILTLTTARIFSSELGPVSALACALEMIHTYSLIHDDLPAMDNDTLRRGRPTCHIAFGTEIATKAGIGLLDQALKVCLLAHERFPELAQPMCRAASELFHNAGFDGMVGGQIADIIAERIKVGLEEVRSIHRYKTAAMIEVAIVMGCLLYTDDDRTIQAFRTFGQKIGLAFQIIDDILDILSESSVLGKNAHSDLERGKATYPALVGIDQSRHDAEQLIEQAVDALSDTALPVQILVEIARYVYNRKM